MLSEPVQLTCLSCRNPNCQFPNKLADIMMTSMVWLLQQDKIYLLYSHRQGVYTADTCTRQRSLLYSSRPALYTLMLPLSACPADLAPAAAEPLPLAVLSTPLCGQTSAAPAMSPGLLLLQAAALQSPLPSPESPLCDVLLRMTVC